MNGVELHFSFGSMGSLGFGSKLSYIQSFYLHFGDSPWHQKSSVAFIGKLSGIRCYLIRGLNRHSPDKTGEVARIE